MTKNKNPDKKITPIRPPAAVTNACDGNCYKCADQDTCDEEDYFDDEDYAHPDRQVVVVAQIHDITACLLDIRRTLASNVVAGTEGPLGIVAIRLAQAAEVLSNSLVTQQNPENSHDEG